MHQRWSDTSRSCNRGAMVPPRGAPLYFTFCSFRFPWGGYCGVQQARRPSGPLTLRPSLCCAALLQCSLAWHAMLCCAVWQTLGNSTTFDPLAHMGEQTGTILNVRTSALGDTE